MVAGMVASEACAARWVWHLLRPFCADKHTQRGGKAARRAATVCDQQSEFLSECSNCGEPGRIAAGAGDRAECADRTGAVSDAEPVQRGAAVAAAHGGCSQLLQLAWAPSTQVARYKRTRYAWRPLSPGQQESGVSGAVVWAVQSEPVDSEYHIAGEQEDLAVWFVHVWEGDEQYRWSFDVPCKSVQHGRRVRSRFDRCSQLRDLRRNNPVDLEDDLQSAADSEIGAAVQHYGWARFVRHDAFQRAAGNCDRPDTHGRDPDAVRIAGPLANRERKFAATEFRARAGSVAATLAAAITLLARMAFWFGGSRRSNDREGGAMGAIAMMIDRKSVGQRTRGALR